MTILAYAIAALRPAPTSHLLMGAVWRDDDDVVAMIRRPAMTGAMLVCHRLTHPAANTNRGA